MNEECECGVQFNPLTIDYLKGLNLCITLKAAKIRKTKSKMVIIKSKITYKDLKLHK
jgi:hypothetical protein